MQGSMPAARARRFAAFTWRCAVRGSGAPPAHQADCLGLRRFEARGPVDGTQLGSRLVRRHRGEQAPSVVIPATTSRPMGAARSRSSCPRGISKRARRRWCPTVPINRGRPGPPWWHQEQPVPPDLSW